LTYINKITKEYPVNYIHIVNRKHSFDDYAIVYNSQKPKITASQTLRELKPLLIGDKYFKQYEILNKTAEQIKQVYLDKKAEVKKAFLEKAEKPRVDTGLGFFVDGDRASKDNFKERWENMIDTDTTTVKDADNVLHQNISRVDVHSIYMAIYNAGDALFSWKWSKEAEIDACSTAEDVDAVVW